MAGDYDKGRLGFSGLSGLASEISGLDDLIKPESGHSTSGPRARRQTSPFESKKKNTERLPKAEAVMSDNTRRARRKWLLGMLGVILMTWLIAYAAQNEKTSFQGAGLEYKKPSVGTDNLLQVSEIRWCIREEIRIGAMRHVLDSEAGIVAFNRVVNDYNSCCGSYRYRPSSRTRAARDVEAFRSEIVSEATHEAGQFGRFFQPSYPSVSPKGATRSEPNRPDFLQTKEVQQLLITLGYNPGPVDGDYGRRTGDAVKAFQRDAGMTPDGRIDRNLLSMLRQAVSVHDHHPPAGLSR